MKNSTPAPVNTIPGFTTALPQMSISGIASAIRRNWKPVNFAAVPYLDAMGSMDKVTDNYGADFGSSIILYFLNNAGTWRGEVAKAVKAELKARLKAEGVRF